MSHEAFYESGTCFAPEIGVYSGWVAHSGSYAASQCGQPCDTSTRLVISGECLNAEGQPEDVRSTYARTCGRFPDGLNGLFSGLVIDTQQSRAILFNDRYAVERLYYYEAADGLYFASEAKALVAALPEARAFDDAGVAEFLSFGCTLGGRTLFRNVRCLEGGTRWIFRGGTSRREKYFDGRAWEEQAPLSAKAFESEFMDTFCGRAVPRCLGDRDDVGVSLTGGLDTRLIMACMPKQGARPVCYTFSGLAGETHDERVARVVASASGLDHHVLRLRQDFITDFATHVDRTVYITDGCAGPCGAHEIYLNAQARELAPIRLTGNFGSEILRSVTTLKPTRLSRDLISADFKPVIDSASAEGTLLPRHPVAFAAFADVPWRLFGTMAAAKSQVVFRTPYLDNEIVALAFRAPETSRIGPGAALSIIEKKSSVLSEIPTDRGLVSGGYGIWYAMSRLLSEVTFKLDYMFTEGLPRYLSASDSVSQLLFESGVLGRHKYLPYRRWFRRELADHITAVLSDAQTVRLPYWDPQTLAVVAADHISGRRNNVREIDAVLTLEAVNRLIVNGQPNRVAQ
jgi:asparagine synthase (glutamine-hydrolysing)